MARKGKSVSEQESPQKSIQHKYKLQPISQGSANLDYVTAYNLAAICERLEYQNELLGHLIARVGMVVESIEDTAAEQLEPMARTLKTELHLIEGWASTIAHNQR